MERKIYFFDIDETLFKTNAKIIVRNEEGKVLRKLSNQEFNGYKLGEGESYDFKEFRSSKIFKTSEPIEKTIQKIKRLQKNLKNEIFLLTARGDFKEPKILIEYLRSFGINIGHKDNDGEIHILRTGDYSTKNKLSTEQAKYDYVKNIILEKPESKKQHIYLFDDYIKNVQAMVNIAHDKEISKLGIKIAYKGELIHEGETVESFMENNQKHIKNISNRKYIKEKYKNKLTIHNINEYIKSISYGEINQELEEIVLAEIEEKLSNSDKEEIYKIINNNLSNYNKPMLEASKKSKKRQKKNSIS